MHTTHTTDHAQHLSPAGGDQPARVGRFARLATITAAAAIVSVLGMAGAASATNKNNPVDPKARCTKAGGTWHSGVGTIQGYCKMRNGDIMVWRDDKIIMNCLPKPQGGFDCF